MRLDTIKVMVNGKEKSIKNCVSGYTGDITFNLNNQVDTSFIDFYSKSFSLKDCTPEYNDLGYYDKLYKLYSYCKDMSFTGNVLIFAEKNSCYWLLDLIVSYYMTNKIIHDSILTIVYVLVENNTACISLETYNNDPYSCLDLTSAIQYIPYTDLELDNSTDKIKLLKLYIDNGVVLFPPER